MSTPSQYLSEFANFTGTLNQGHSHVPSPVGNGTDLSAALRQAESNYNQLSLKSQTIIQNAEFDIRTLKADNATLAKTAEGLESKLTTVEEKLETAETKLREAVELSVKETGDLKKEKTDLELKLQTAEQSVIDLTEKLRLAEEAKTALETEKAALTTDLAEAKRLVNNSGAVALGLPVPGAPGAPAAAQAAAAGATTTEQGVTTPAVAQLTAEQIQAQQLAGSDPEAARTFELKSKVGEYRRLKGVFETNGSRANKAALDAYRVANETDIYAAQVRGY